jgi:hypothetical protein
LAPIRISSSAQNIAFYVPKSMAAMGDGSSKPKTCAMALKSIGWQPALWIAFKYGFAAEHVIFANGIAVQSHMGGADLESKTSEKLPRAVQAASHHAKLSRRALFLPSGLPHKNVD